jgi:hypothetical protein
MKNGDKIVYIGCKYNLLKEGEIYILDLLFYKKDKVNYLTIKGIWSIYNTEYFVSLKEYRKEKLKKLNNYVFKN